jgi:hypothetical protein
MLVYYTGKDKTLEKKWININSGYVIFRNYKFDIITKRIVNLWYTGGIHFLFPTKVSCLFYSWYSRFPHDPDNYANVWETPEVRKMINKEEWVKSYAKGFSPQAAKKPSFMQQWMPFISILAVVLIGFYLYTNQQELAQHIAIIENSLNAITR